MIIIGKEEYRLVEEIIDNTLKILHEGACLNDKGLQLMLSRKPKKDK